MIKTKPFLFLRRYLKQYEEKVTMKRITVVLLVVASLMFVSNVFAADANKVEIGGTGEYSLTFESVKAEGADDKTYMKLGDGDKIWVKATAEKTLDTGTVVAIGGGFELKPGSFDKGDRWIKVTSGATTWQIFTPDAPDCFGKGQDVYLPDAGVGPYEAKGWVKDRGFSMKYAAETMTFVATVRYQGGNEMGIRPHVQLKAGPATIKLAGEYYMKKGEDTDAKEVTNSFGGGVHVETSAGIATIGGAGTYSSEGGTTADDKDKSTQTTMSGTVYAKVNVGPGTVGAGAMYTQWKDDDSKAEKTSLGTYVSYEMGNFIAQGLKLKLGAGMAMGGEDLDGSDKTGGKVVLAYGF